MIDNQIYIDKVLEKFSRTAKTCRPAIVFFDKANKDMGAEGFIIGNKYFINTKTFDICDKSTCYLVNYLDEDPEYN